MHVLALDTTTRDGSVALVSDGQVIAERRGDPSRTHAQRLPGELLALMDAHGVSTERIDVFAVASGPGSFTGLRIGIATIQGLALTIGRPIVSVSALEALAEIAARTMSPGSVVAAWVDAHRHEVYAALYELAGRNESLSEMREIEGPTVGAPATTLQRWANQPGLTSAAFIGDGATLYEDVIHGRLAAAAVRDVPLLAGAIGQIATHRARLGGGIHPAAIQPLYVRRPDAEVAREKVSGSRP